MRAWQPGQSTQAVVAGFLSSAEYQASHPDDASFLAALYTDVLGRAADPSGLGEWLARLQGGQGRHAVALDFLASPEVLAGLVVRDYADYLGRPADPVGTQGFLAFLGTAPTPPVDTVAALLLASDEFDLRPTSPALIALRLMRGVFCKDYRGGGC